MKKLLSTLGLAVVMKGGVYGQGTFDFANGAPGVNAPISTAVGGVHLIPTGTMYTVGYYWSASSTLNSLGVLASGNFGATTVNPSSSPGYFFGGTTTIAGQTGTVFIQPVVWLTSDGSLANAFSQGAESGHYGLFNPVSVALAVPPTGAPGLVGLNPLLLTIPEPATFALVGLGVAGLLWFRRRK